MKIELAKKDKLGTKVRVDINMRGGAATKDVARVAAMQVCRSATATSVDAVARDMPVCPGVN